jgi:hypothetical protein
VIRVYDSVGNVIEAQEHPAISGSRRLLFVEFLDSFAKSSPATMAFENKFIAMFPCNRS